MEMGVQCLFESRGALQETMIRIMKLKPIVESSRCRRYVVHCTGTSIPYEMHQELEMPCAIGAGIVFFC